jgi:hypothetical protein
MSRFINSFRFIILSTARKADLAWGELTGYQWKVGKDGEQLDEPLKKDDHFPDAFRYGVFTRYWRQIAKEIKGQPTAIEQPEATLHTSQFR